MNKTKRILALLLAIMLMVAMIGSVQVFADGGVVGDDSDIDVPFYPTKTIRNLSIPSKPTKLTYLQGEALDLSGLVVKAVYIDNTNRIITDYHVSGFDPNVLGEQTVSVSYSGKTTSFKVTVYAIGDVNGDSVVDGNDATLLLQYVARWNVTVIANAADADGNGTVDGDDATLLLQYAAGWNVKLGK